jgi:hypothetical protein
MDWSCEYEKLRQGLKPLCAGWGMSRLKPRPTRRKAPGPRDFFCCNVRFAPVAGALGYNGPASRRGTERAVGKYDSFPMDAITERGYFAGEMGILART